METTPDWKGNTNHGSVEISKTATLKPFTVVNVSTTDKPTIIGDDCYLMPFSYVGHDSKLGKSVQLAPGAKVAGFCEIGDNTIVGMNATIHQNSKIGKYCMIGASSFFKGTSPDGLVWVGVPSRPIKINKVGLDRSDLSVIDKNKIEDDARKFIDNFH